jgi:hypothetical protein
MAILMGFPPSNTISPSVRITETDLSLILPQTSTHTAGLVGFCSKGPINLPTQIATTRDLHTVFGYPHPDNSDPYLIYAAEQYLLVANTLYIVRVADESPVSSSQATFASVQVPSAGSQAGLFSSVPQGGVVYGGVPAFVIPDNTKAASNLHPHGAYYFRWRLNGKLSSKTLVLLPGTYTAAQLCDPNNVSGLAAQVDPIADGVEFVAWAQPGDPAVNGVSYNPNYAGDAQANATRVMFRSHWSYGPDASVELVSIQNSLYGGPQNAIDHWSALWTGLDEYGYGLGNIGSNNTVVASVTVAAAGQGYVLNDILTLQGGDNNATVKVTQISGLGYVTNVTLVNTGTGYTVNSTLTTVDTTGTGTGTGCQVTVTALTSQVSSLGAVQVVNGGTGYQVRDVLTLTSSTLTGAGGTVTVQAVDSTTGAVTDIVVNAIGAAYGQGLYNVTGGHGANNATIAVTELIQQTWNASQATDAWTPGTTLPAGGNVLNPLGFGTYMQQAVVAGSNNKYPNNSYISNGKYDLSASGLYLQVVIEGTDNVLIDDVVQTIYFSDLAKNVDVATVCTEINNQAQGFFAYALGGTVILSTETFGQDSAIYVKPTSAAAIFGFPNQTQTGYTDSCQYGSSDSYAHGIGMGCCSAMPATNFGYSGTNLCTATCPSNNLANYTFQITADSKGIEGNNTQVVVDTDPSTGTFTVNVYSNGVQVEQWGGLTKNQSSSYYIESYISLVSDYIRIVDVTTNPAAPLAGTYTLSGGSDGIPPNPDDQDLLIVGSDVGMTGMYAMSDPEQVDIDLVAAPGRASTEVITSLLNLCQNVRMDCFAIIDPPFGLTVSEIVDWQNGAHPLNLTRFDSDFGALYWPWLRYRDNTNQLDVWVPPSGSILAVYAHSDDMAAPWFAPAGLTRGIVPNITGTFQRPSLAERDQMYGNRNAVNPIVNFMDVSSYVVFGQKTLQRLPTALDRVNVRRMMLYIEKVIKSQSRLLLFEPNDQILWNQFIQMASTVCEEVKGKRGITDYLVQCDSTLNTPDVIDRNELHARIGIQPTRAVEFIFINFSIYRTGSFTDPANNF